MILLSSNILCNIQIGSKATLSFISFRSEAVINGSVPV